MLIFLLLLGLMTGDGVTEGFFGCTLRAMQRWASWFLISTTCAVLLFCLLSVFVMGFACSMAEGTELKAASDL